jgi:hypothetical protein
MQSQTPQCRWKVLPSRPMFGHSVSNNIASIARFIKLVEGCMDTTSSVLHLDMGLCSPASE